MEGLEPDQELDSILEKVRSESVKEFATAEEIHWRGSLDMELGVEGNEDVCTMEETTMISFNRRKMLMDGRYYRWRENNEGWEETEE